MRSTLGADRADQPGRQPVDALRREVNSVAAYLNTVDLPAEPPLAVLDDYEAAMSAVSWLHQEFHRQRLTGSFRLDPGARHDIPFPFDVPWETPITEVYGQHLHGMTMGLGTELEVPDEARRRADGSGVDRPDLRCPIRS